MCVALVSAAHQATEKPVEKSTGFFLLCAERPFRGHETFVVVSGRQLFPNANSSVDRYGDPLSPCNYKNVVVLLHIPH
jgi:hypothetical protein